MALCDPGEVQVNFLESLAAARLLESKVLAGLSQTLQHLLNLMLFGLTAAIGLRPPWDLVWLGGLLAPFALAFWLGVIVWIFRSHRNEPQQQGADSATFEGRWLLTGVILVLVVAFLLTPFGADPSGRYFLPLAAPLALYAAELIVALKYRYGKWTFSLVGVVLLFQLTGILQSGLKNPPGITTQFYSLTQVDHRYDQILIDFC